MLQIFFNSIVVASDGNEGLELFKSNNKYESSSFDLIITDIEMPNLDGHTLTRRVKEDKVLRDLPVIIFSSLITNDLKHKGDSVGADAQMSKPEIGKLIQVVDRILVEHM